MTNEKIEHPYDLEIELSPEPRQGARHHLTASNGKYEGGNDVETVSNASSMDSSLNESNVKYQRTVCQRFRNLRGLYNSLCYLALTFILTILYFCVCLIRVIMQHQ